MMVMFALITFAQYFAADAVGSQALKADVVSMGVDAFSYFGNILGESADHPAQRIVTQLIFSMGSILLLLYFNTSILLESIGILNDVENGTGDYAPKPDGDEGDDTINIEGVITITFAGLGLVFDFVCLYAYYYYAKKDAEIEHQAMLDNLDESQTGEKAKIAKPEINMLSALLHVSADLFRSSSTFILGILMVSGALSQKQQDEGDAILAIIIGATIYIAAAYALYEWFFAFRDWFTSLAKLQVTEGEKTKTGDIFLG